MGLHEHHDSLAITAEEYHATPVPRGEKESYRNAPFPIARPRWQEQAACRGVGPALFFPERGARCDAALAYCDRCPVTTECGAYADTLNDQSVRFGIWGGEAANQRRTNRVGAILAAEGRSWVCPCGLRPIKYRRLGLCSRCYERRRYAAAATAPTVHECGICHRTFGRLNDIGRHLSYTHFVNDPTERARHTITRISRATQAAALADATERRLAAIRPRRKKTP